MNFFPHNSLLCQGVPITIAHPIITPKFKLSDEVPMTDEIRVEVQNWLNKFFGVSVLDPLDGKIFRTSEGFFMSPETYDKLKKAIL